MNTNKLKRLAGLVMSAVIIAFCAINASGCNKSESSSSDATQPSSSAAAESTKDEAAVSALEQLGIDAASLGIEPDIMYDTEHEVGFQLDTPEDDDTIAVLQTSMGDIAMRFFPEQAPKTVTNFLKLAENGSYNGTVFHRVIKDFIVQGGHCGTDTNQPNGVSSYGSEFEDEFCDKLFNIRGAVSMATTESDTNGSQFFINQTSAEDFLNSGGFEKLEQNWQNAKTQLLNYKDSDLMSAFIKENGDKCYNTDIVSDEVKKLYETYGGNPYLDGAYNAVDRGQTVFAQVIDGMDVVDKIASVEVDENNLPKTNVVIKSVKITTYAEYSKTQTTASSAQ